MTPYEQSIIKLTSLREQILAGNPQSIEDLRRYEACSFCTAFRRSMTEHYDGVCGECPCHKLGMKESGRDRSYNGCYVVGPYRQMVKSAFVYAHDPCRENALKVVEAVEDCIKYMVQHRGELE